MQMGDEPLHSLVRRVERWLAKRLATEQRAVAEEARRAQEEETQLKQTYRDYMRAATGAMAAEMLASWSAEAAELKLRTEATERKQRTRRERLRGGARSRSL